MKNGKIQENTKQEVQMSVTDALNKDIDVIGEIKFANGNNPFLMPC